MGKGLRRGGLGLLSLLGLGAVLIEGFKPAPFQLRSVVRPAISHKPLPRVFCTTTAVQQRRLLWGASRALEPVRAAAHGAERVSAGGWRARFGSFLGRLGRVMTALVLPALLALVLRPLGAMAGPLVDADVGPMTQVVTSLSGRLFVPIMIGMYCSASLQEKAKAEAKRVKKALEEQEKAKQAYIEDMKKQGINLGGVGGTFSKDEEDMLKRVEKGEQLLTKEKAAWVKLLQRAQYSRDVVDGKVNANPDVAIMTKREIKRVSAANKQVKEMGFASE